MSQLPDRCQAPVWILPCRGRVQIGKAYKKSCGVPSTAGFLHFDLRSILKGKTDIFLIENCSGQVKLLHLERKSPICFLLRTESDLHCTDVVSHGCTIKNIMIHSLVQSLRTIIDVLMYEFIFKGVIKALHWSIIIRTS